MPRFVVLIMLGLTGCVASDTSQETDFGSGEMSGWRQASGKAPSRAEYAAMVAACEDGAVQHGAAASLDACLAGLGLTRAP
jgi:hypothetical protein